MQIEFADSKLKRVATDKTFTAGLAPAIVRGFRKVVQVIIAAPDERELYRRPALRFEKLARDRSEHSLRMNDQYRVIVELLGVAPNKTVRIIKIEDYH
jgi:proteic killer suppression protein